jgi:hypothetical protein
MRAGDRGSATDATHLLATLKDFAFDIDDFSLLVPLVRHFLQLRPEAVSLQFYLLPDSRVEGSERWNSACEGPGCRAQIHILNPKP